MIVAGQQHGRRGHHDVSSSVIGLTMKWWCWQTSRIPMSGVNEYSRASEDGHFASASASASASSSPSP